ncbi:hypothetical protein [Dokdonella sp.]|uniref:hypothetical protein n=1 Tax=Dokdonella sp. TaxID=2291710 RepID=UPI0031C89EA1|nr:hypothetical protein [Dokdonella sp.]
MYKTAIVAFLCVFALGACSEPRAPDDAQLAQILRAENASPADASAPIDRPAVECLRAWSGDAKLLKGLSIRYAGEDGKRTCRRQLDQRLADAARNPDRYSFDEMTRPETVERAVALLQANEAQGAAVAPVRAAPPMAMTSSRSKVKDLATPDPAVDLGAAGARLKEAENMCLEVRAQVAAKPELKRFADYCGGSLNRLRRTLEASARNGATPERLAKLADPADNLAQAARDQLAAASGNP